MPSSTPSQSAVAKRQSSKRASGSSSNALTTHSTSNALMPAPPPPKRIKRPSQVLDEDIYTESLSKIIARDFFPGLAETEAQHEFLDAQASKDSAWIQAAGERLAAVMTPKEHDRRGTRLHSETENDLMETVGATPRGWVGDTPRAHQVPNSSENHIKDTDKVDLNMSLSAFQAKYTSEDNESFNKLLDKQNEGRRKKYAWMWNGNKISSARQIAWDNRQEQINKKEKEQEHEDGKKLQVFEVQDKRKAMPDTWKSRPDNNLMFEPDSVEDISQTVQQKAEDASRAGPKSVVYANTRMAPPSDIVASGGVPASPSISAIDDAIARRPRQTASEQGDQPGGETPRVNGYAFVDPEASPEPKPKPIFDWSQFSLGPGDENPNPFKIKEQSSREELHHRMVDKVAKANRAQQLVSQSKTPIPKFMSSPRPGKEGLTPAGQRLLGKVGGRTPAGSTWDRGKTPARKSNIGIGWTPNTKRHE